MRSEGGPEVAVIEASGWDTHANQGGSQRHARPASARTRRALRTLAGGIGPAMGADRRAGRHRIRPHRRHERHSRHRSWHGRLRVPGRRRRAGRPRIVADWPGLTAQCPSREPRPQGHAGSAQRVQRRSRRAHARRCKVPGHPHIPGQRRRAGPSRADARLSALARPLYDAEVSVPLSRSAAHAIVAELPVRCRGRLGDRCAGAGAGAVGATLLGARHLFLGGLRRRLLGCGRGLWLRFFRRGFRFRRLLACEPSSPFLQLSLARLP